MSTESPILSQLIEHAYRQAMTEQYIDDKLETEVLALGQTADKESLKVVFGPLLREYVMRLVNTSEGDVDNPIVELNAAFLVASLLIELGLTSSLYPNDVVVQNGFIETIRNHQFSPYFRDIATNQSAGSSNPIWQVILMNLA